MSLGTLLGLGAIAVGAFAVWKFGVFGSWGKVTEIFEKVDQQTGQHQQPTKSPSWYQNTVGSGGTANKKGIGASPGGNVLDRYDPHRSVRPGTAYGGTTSTKPLPGAAQISKEELNTAAKYYEKIGVSWDWASKLADTAGLKKKVHPL